MFDRRRAIHLRIAEMRRFDHDFPDVHNHLRRAFGRNAKPRGTMRDFWVIPRERDFMPRLTLHPAIADPFHTRVFDLTERMDGHVHLQN